MPRYVTIDEITGKVVNVGQATNLNLLEDPGEARRHIAEDDWVTGSDPAIGDEWDGQIPTTFTRPGDELADKSISDLLDCQAELRAQSAAVDNELRSRLS